MLSNCQYSTRLIGRLKELDEDHQIDLKQVDLAIAWAKKYHGDQKRKSGEPYYTHPIEVAYIVSNYLLTTNVIIAAILHDTVEDTEATLEMIANTFNQDIADQVEGLTRVKIDKKIPSGETVNILFCQHKMDVLHIKLCDRLHNMRTIRHLPSEKIDRIIDETISYFIPLAVHLGIPEIIEELKSLCLEASTCGQSSETSPATRKNLATPKPSVLSPTFQNVIEQIYNSKEQV